MKRLHQQYSEIMSMPVETRLELYYREMELLKKEAEAANKGNNG